MTPFSKKEKTHPWRQGRKPCTSHPLFNTTILTTFQYQNNYLQHKRRKSSIIAHINTTKNTIEHHQTHTNITQMILLQRLNTKNCPHSTIGSAFVL